MIVAIPSLATCSGGVREQQRSGLKLAVEVPETILIVPSSGSFNMAWVYKVSGPDQLISRTKQASLLRCTKKALMNVMATGFGNLHEKRNSIKKELHCSALLAFLFHVLQY